MSLVTAVAIALSLLAPVCQGSKPAQDPASLLERARFAEETGDAAKAEALLREAVASKSPAVAAQANDRLAALLVRLGRQGARTTASQPADLASPIARRVSDAISHLGMSTEEDTKAINEIVWVGDPAIPVLESYFASDASPRLKDQLLSVVSQIGGDGAFAFLDRILASPDDLLRRKAAASLTLPSRVAKDRWALAYARFLDDRDAATRREALSSLLGRREGVEAVKPFVEKVLGDPDPRVRAELAKGTSPLSPEQRVALEKDSSAIVRRAFAQNLRRSDAPDWIAVATRLLRDSATEVRIEALESVASRAVPRERRPEIEAAIRDAAADGDPMARREAADAAGRVLGGDGVPLLLQLTQDDDTEVAKRAVSRLGTVPGEEFRREHLSSVLETESALLRRYSLTPQNATPADVFQGFFGTFLDRVSKSEDVPRILELIAQAPALTTNGAVSPFLLRKATSAQFDALVDSLAKIRDPIARRAVLERIAIVFPASEADAPKRVADAVREDISVNADPELRRVAVRVAIRAGADELASDVASAIGLFSGSDLQQLAESLN
ncbi:MAG TPA: hypothetical protein VKE69_07235, partial [Planctomycetota bacterium]|nr:hypothetical protein [Planctomycetota bacterium]